MLPKTTLDYNYAYSHCNKSNAVIELIVTKKTQNANKTEFARKKRIDWAYILPKQNSITRSLVVWPLAFPSSTNLGVQEKYVIYTF